MNLSEKDCPSVHLVNNVLKGDDGGYYTPKVSPEGELTWVPSEEGMPIPAESNIRGPIGETGEPGPQGIPGERGEQGERGLQGERGPQGEKGEPGKQGPMGPQGPQGKQGIQGPAGQDGSVSFDKLTDKQKEEIRGPQGIPGPVGPKGDRGERGLQGEPGIQGVAGPQGKEGKPGPIGPQGNEGPMGPQGPRGLQGEKGPKGEVGPRGLTGPEGKQGLQGIQGEPGNSGVYRGISAPVDPEVKVWINPDGDPSDGIKVEHSQLGDADYFITSAADALEKVGTLTDEVQVAAPQRGSQLMLMWENGNTAAGLVNLNIQGVVAPIVWLGMGFLGELPAGSMTTVTYDGNAYWIEQPNMLNYATKADLEPLATKTELEPLATKQYVDDAVAAIANYNEVKF